MGLCRKLATNQNCRRSFLRIVNLTGVERRHQTTQGNFAKRRLCRPESKLGLRLKNALLKSELACFRGLMVPQHAFPPGANRGIALHFKTAATGFADTGYPCRGEQDPPSLTITGPVPNLLTVGAYRFLRHDLEDLVGKAATDATLAALPDRYSGHRLAGHAKDRAALQAALAELGANPLIAGAFRDRSPAS